MVLIIIIFIFVPSAVCLVEGNFKYTEVYSETSPDGISTLTLLKRTAFPANEIVDPSIIVKIQITGHTPSVIKERLSEDSDLIQEPKIEWNESIVTISELSTRKPIILKFKKNHTTSE